MRTQPLSIFLLILLQFICGCQESPQNTYSPTPYLRSFDSVEQLSTYLEWTPDRTPILSAHRGGPLPGFPENALETFENILHYAPALIECDVRMSSDGALMLLHDETLERTTNGSGQVKDFTLNALSRLKLKDNDGNLTDFKIPTLAQTLEWARGKAVLTLDIKRGISPTAVVEAIRQANAQPYVVVITYNLNAALDYHRLDPDLMISASARGPEGTKRLLASSIPTNRLIAFVGVGEPDPTVYKHLQQNGISAILGTMGNLDRRAASRGVRIYRELIANGATVLATDRVPEAALALH